MSGVILCCYCSKPIVENDFHTCSSCNKIFCGECVVQKRGAAFCVSCYSSGLGKAAKKRFDEILASRGMKVQMPKLSFKGMAIKELSELRLDEGRFELKVKCADNPRKTFDVDRQTFDYLWKQAQDLGYKPERIPFGRRIIT